MSVTVVSFGFKYGLPLDADMIWDVRFLPNPFYIPEYRHKTGRVQVVNDYIHSFDVTDEFKNTILIPWISLCLIMRRKAKLNLL